MVGNKEIFSVLMHGVSGSCVGAEGREGDDERGLSPRDVIKLRPWLIPGPSRPLGQPIHRWRVDLLDFDRDSQDRGAARRRPGVQDEGEVTPHYGTRVDGGTVG